MTFFNLLRKPLFLISIFPQLIKRLLIHRSLNCLNLFIVNDPVGLGFVARGECGWNGLFGGLEWLVHGGY